MPIVAGECRHRGREEEGLRQCVACLEHEFENVRIKVVPTDGQGPALWLKPSEVYLTGFKTQ